MLNGYLQLIDIMIIDIKLIRLIKLNQAIPLVAQ